VNTNVKGYACLVSRVYTFRESYSEHVNSFLALSKMQNFIYAKFMRTIYTFKTCLKGEFS